MTRQYINFSVIFKQLIGYQTSRITLSISIFFVFALFISSTVMAQSAKGKREVLQKTNIIKLQKLQATFQKRQRNYKKEAERIAIIKGWKLAKIGKHGNFMELMRVNSSGDPMYFTTNNLGAAKTTRANTLWTGGSRGLNLNGEGITLGIWDAGAVDIQHQEWQNNITLSDSAEPHAHSTHVGGTMVAKGFVPEAKGMANKAILNSYDWNDESAEMSSAAANGLLLSNHSYGWNGASLSLQEFGRYDDWAQNWDEIMFNAPYYLAVNSAGNDQTRGYNPSKNGYDVLNGVGSAKNNLVVAAVEAVNNYTSSSSVVMSNFSSWGPTDDGRIKPDISAQGVSVYSTLSGGISEYGTYDGTSMAAPNVTGSLGLLQQHYHNTFNSYMKAATLKALVLTTADEAGDTPGPDYKFGWGLLNVEAAVMTISEAGKNTVLNELTLNNESTYTTTINTNGTQPLTIAIAWTDQAGTPVQGIDNPQPMLVNDLDIIIIKDNETFMPWKLDPANPSNAASQGDNVVDNVELVNIDNVTEGAYTITVSHKGTLLGGNQDFSLVVIGGTRGEPICEVAIPNGVMISDIDDISAVFSWNHVTLTSSYDYRYRKVGTSVWTTINSQINAVNLTSLLPFTNYEIQVRSNCPNTNSSFSSSITFKTLELCGGTVPTGISILPVANNIVNTEFYLQMNHRISWNPIEAVDKYNLRYRELATSQWTDLLVSGSSIDLIGLAFNTDYEVQINAICNNGTVSAYSQSVNFTTSPACMNSPVQNFHTTNISETEVNLEWDAQVGRTFEIRYKPDYSYTWLHVESNTNGTTLTDLVPGSLYKVEIKHFCAGGTPDIISLGFTTLGFKPCSVSKVTGLSASNIRKDEATISWDPLPNAVKYNYTLSVDGSISGSTTNSFVTLTGLTGTFYLIDVNVECVDGEQSPNTSIFFETDDPCNNQAPQNIHTSDVNTTTATIDWDIVKDALSYRVKYKPENSSSFSEEKVFSNTVILNDLMANTAYEVMIDVSCLEGYSPKGQFNFNTTGAQSCTVVPTGLSVSNVTAGGANISWDVVSEASSYNYRYRISGGSWATLASTNISANLSGLSPGTTYQVQVNAECSNETSAYSSTVNFTTVACSVTVPTGLAVSGITTSGANVSWNSVSEATSYNYRYRISGETWTTQSSNNTSVNLSELSAETSYQIQVNAKCSTETSPYSNIVNFTTSACSVTVPTGLVVSEITANGANVSWNAVSEASSYNYRYRISGGIWTTKTTNNTSDMIFGLEIETTYEIQVKAKCLGSSGSTSNYSGKVTFTTAEEGPTSCNLPPKNFRVTNVSTTSISLAWHPVNNNYEFISSTTYQLKYKPENSWYKYKTIAANEITLTGLTANTNYTVQVKAYCKGGSSPYANLSFTTQTTNTENSTVISSVVDSKYIAYPNPNTGIFTIDFKEKEAIIKSVTVYDMFGIKVFHKDYNRKLNVIQYSLGLVKSGLYKIAIRTENTIKYQSLLIEH